MAKLSGSTTAMKPKIKVKIKAGKSSVGKTKGKELTNVGGGVGTELKAKSELFLTAISTFAGEDTFYESGSDRIDRVRELVAKITESDPEWLQRFIPWLRGDEVNIRTISLIIAAEYVAAGGSKGRMVIDSVCQRADEPAEILAYWMQTYYGWDNMTYPMPSPKLPQALRKGLQDACIRLYDQYTLLKYDGNSRGVSMPQVLNLVHPAPSDPQKAAIFQIIIDKAYGNEPTLDELPMIAANLALRTLDPADMKKKLTTSTMREAGVTWEQLGGMLGGPWTSKAWEAIIPTMGYMAMLRNLRNFEGAGINDKTVELVIDKLTDPEQVERSRQFPFRFLSAYKNTNSNTYSRALEKALDLSVKNIPSFDGRTLVLVDKSGSMNGFLSSSRGRYVDPYAINPGAPMLWEVGALFGVALALKGESVDLAIFGDRSKLISLPKGSSVLKAMNLLSSNQGVGHGTNIWGSVREQFSSHDRVVIFTDMQDNARSQGSDLKSIPFIHYFDIGGYGQGAPLKIGTSGRYHYGGFSDATFKLMALLEHTDGSWPF